MQLGSTFAPPVPSKKITLVVVVHLEFSLVSMAKRFANAVREMNVGGRDDHRVRVFLDVHYPVERVRPLLLGLIVPRESGQFLPVLPDEAAAQGDDPGRIFIANAMASLATLLMCIDGPRCRPLPAAIVKYGATIRTERRFR